MFLTQLNNNFWDIIFDLCNDVGPFPNDFSGFLAMNYVNVEIKEAVGISNLSTL